MQDKIERSIDIKAPVEKVWDAVSDYKKFGEWFKVALDGPFVEGGISTGRITYPGYEHLRWVVRIERIEENRLFAFSWRPYDDDENITTASEISTLVEFVLTPTDDGTRLVISESGFSALPDDDRREEAFRRNSGGWDQQQYCVRDYVES